MNLDFISWNETPFSYKGPIPPATYVRKEFEVKKGLHGATLIMTSLGNYVPYINGRKLGEQLLTPGYTEYSVRLQYQEYNVQELLHDGKNVLGAIVGDGWYRGSCGPMGVRATYGDKLALAAKLILSYENEETVIITDSSWKWTQDGPIRQQDMKLIEHYVAAMELRGWNEAGFDDSSWRACIPSEYKGELVPSESVPVLKQEIFSPKILKTPNGETILDFSQNMAGLVHFKVTGKKGQTVHLFHGEALDENGNFTTKNIGDDRILRLGQEIVYELRDGVQEYEPLFLVCGFRYVKVVDWPEEINVENFEAIAIYSDIPMTGRFVCSNEKINKLVENVRWSLKSNFIDIPTDCPHRERAGWTGDINIFSETANLLSDTRLFFHKWMKDVVATQTKDGAILSIVPKVFMMNRKSNETAPGAAGWADVITQLPMRQYLSYGETGDLELCYEAMKKYVDYNENRAKKNSLRAFRYLKEDRPYILDTGYHYGEWLEPGSANLIDALKAYISPDAEVATAWFFYSAKTLADTAKILGKDNDEQKYRSLSEKIKNAYVRNFLKESDLSSLRQCKYVRPLYMGLVEGELRDKVAKKLNELVVQNHYHIGTGFLTTYQILQALSDNGYNKSAYRMLENEDCPGWLYEVNCGATTPWEGWDAIDPGTGKVKGKSLNHYSPGAAISWLWTRCAGI